MDQINRLFNVEKITSNLTKNELRYLANVTKIQEKPINVRSMF